MINMSSTCIRSSHTTYFTDTPSRCSWMHSSSSVDNVRINYYLLSIILSHAGTPLPSACQWLPVKKSAHNGWSVVMIYASPKWQQDKYRHHSRFTPLTLMLFNSNCSIIGAVLTALQSAYCMTADIWGMNTACKSKISSIFDYWFLNNQ